MSERINPDFYTVEHAPLGELMSMEKTDIVQMELKRRAAEALQQAYALYLNAFGDAAAGQFSDDAGRLVRHE